MAEREIESLNSLAEREAASDLEQALHESCNSFRCGTYSKLARRVPPEVALQLPVSSERQPPPRRGKGERGGA